MNLIFCRWIVRPDALPRFSLLLIAAMCAGDATASFAATQTVITQNNELSVDVSPVDNRLAIDLHGSIWLLPAAGGPANPLTETRLPARRPRWSPDGREILFQAAAGPLSQIWRIDLESGEQTRIHAGDHYDQDAVWHPQGNRVVFSSDRRGTGFDLWETDLQTGLSWRISNHPGDESQPTWSASGRDLAYILKDGDHWVLMLRRFGEPDTELLRSATSLAAPSFRPDGTLLTYFQQIGEHLSLQMAILSDPPLIRQLARPDAYSMAPISWLNRNRLFYAVGGQIKSRGFDDWSARTVAFWKNVPQPPVQPEIPVANRELPILSPAADNLVIRSERLFDGLSRRYRAEIDVRIQDGLIAEVTPRKDWGDLTVIELSNTTLLPGLIDAYAGLASTAAEPSGATLLSWGVTTVISPDLPDLDAATWEGEEQPGPRLLRAQRVQSDAATDTDLLPDDEAVFLWTIAAPLDHAIPTERIAALRQRGRPVMAESGMLGLRLGLTLALGTDLLPAENPTSPNAMTVISGMSAATPDVASLFELRQAAGFSVRRPDVRVPVSTSSRNLRGAGNRVVAGSRPGGLPPGLALHAELRTMAAAGLPGDQVLKAAGSNAARILGLSGQLGQISPGARADLLLVNGDPLSDVADLQNIVAVVRNGRFYSLIALLEMAQGVD